MKLNRNASNWTELERNKTNENWDIIEGSYNNVVGKISDEVVGHLIDSAKLNWKEPVDTVEDLPSNAEEGDTRMVREGADGIAEVYRYDGERWSKIQEFDATAINELDSRLTTQLAETENQQFYESMIDRKRPRPMITWVDDDGHRGVYTKLRPLALEYGIVFTSAIITERPHGFPDDNRSWNNRYIHYNEMLEMQKEGTGEFASHSHNHNANHRPDQMTESELREDFLTSREIMRKYGFNYRGLIMPFGTYTERETDIARDYFSYAVGTSTRGDNIIIPPVDNYNLLRTNAQLGFDVVKAQIDRAIENDAWLILTTHVDAGDWYSEEYARQIIEYALQQGLDFVTTEEGINAHGNIAQFGSNSISADGQIFGNELGRVVIDNSVNINGSTPTTYFKKNKITHSRISANRGGFPRNASGVLETHKIFDSSENTWDYQKFTTTRNKMIYYRYWNSDNEDWTDWIGVGNHHLKPINTIDNSTLLSEFEFGTTITAVPASNNIFPGDAGVVKTYRAEANRYGYQEFKQNGEFNKYIRHAESDGSWSAWKKFALVDVE